MADTYYNRFVAALGAPQNCELSVVGTTGSTVYKYQVAAYNWNGETIPCVALTVSTGNATLTTSNYNYLEWDVIPGAYGYCIYGRLDDSTYGLLYKSQVSDFIEISATRIGFNDQGQNTPVHSILPMTQDTSGRQNWDRVMFRANKAIQSAELNEIQAMQDFYMDNLGRAFFREGSVIKGCSPSIADDLVTVTITSGEVYIAGKIRHIDGDNVVMGGVGAETIGILVTEVIQTETDDTALHDPAVGAYNYQKDSAHRRVFIFDWVMNNPMAVKVFDCQNGAVIVASSDTDYAQLNKILATRTYEESGNYVVDSTVILVKEHSTDTTKLALSVDALRAYVQGYRVERTKGAVLNLNKARDTKNVPEEQFDKTPTTYIYELATDFVKDINTCYATMAGTGSFTKGTAEGQDFIHSSLTKITSVTQGGTTYIENVDWKRTGNNIDWSLGGAEPVTGTSYNINYQYRATLTKGTRTKTTVTNEAVVRGGSPNTYDNLANIDLIAITSVSSLPDGGGTVYAEDVDWYMVDGQEDDHFEEGKVHWNLPGSEPSGGSTYYVTYSYWDHTVEGDFVCAGSYDSYSDISTYAELDLRDSIDIRHPTGWGGIYPIDDNINVDYDYYLTRRDLLVVSIKGELSIIEGISDVNPARPKPKEDTMSLAELRVQAYTYSPGNVQVTMLETRRSTMEDIKTIERRVNNIEYYQALDLLEKDAIDEYTIDAKSGVLVDNFKGSSRTDLYFNKGGITFGVAFDTARECLQMRSASTNIDLESTISTSSTTKKTGKMVTLPYTSALCESQPFASEKINVTPYLVFPYFGNLSLDPREDYWVDTEQAPDLRVQTGPTADEMDFWTSQEPWNISATPWEQHITGVKRTNIGWGWGKPPNAEWNNRNTWWGANETSIETQGFNDRKVTQVSYSAETQIKDMGDRIIDTTIAPYIRSKLITVTGEKLRPNTEIALKMDDKVLPMVAIPPTVAGPHSGCVVTNSTGKFNARFTIPAATFNTGERSIEVYDYSGDPDDDTSASAVYNAMGIGQTRQKTYLSASYIQPNVNVVAEAIQFKTTQTIVEPLVFAPQVKTDPLSQSFQYGTSFFLTQVGLFFATKDTSQPCTVQIRTMDNGYPAPGVLGTMNVYPSQITADERGVSETRITFPEPIFIEEGKWHCLCILSNVTTYNMWIAKMGAIDITTGNLITKQPHDGTLFTSSNNVTWVADPNADLKFKMYCAIFSPTTADMILNTQSIDASILSLSSTEVLPGNTSDKLCSLTWYMDDNPPSSYDKILRTNETTYLQYVAPQCKLKATLTTNDRFLSPILNLERLGLIHAKYDTGTKSYITRNTDVSTNPFDNIKIILEANKPTNTNARIYYSIDDGYNWVELVTPTSTRTVDNFWTEYQYLVDTLSDETTFRIRIDLISTTASNTPRIRKLRVIAY